MFGTSFAIPGYLVWAALLYAIVGTTLTHLVGWPLVGLNFRQQRFEADFRFNLVRVRENSEQIALLRGETDEREQLLDRFGRLVGNFMQIMLRTKQLTFLTASYTQVSTIFPFIVISPAYFAGTIQLGGLMQTASAFSSVQTALSFFVNAYRQLAEWRAVIARLDGFNIAVESAQAAATATPGIEVAPHAGKDAIRIEDLVVRLPQGGALVAADDLVISAGERVLVTGASGAGKSTLFRAIAGTWPFGAGTIHVPKGAKVMTLPQRPYFSIGTLAAAITYPAEPGTFSAEALAEVITAVGLPALAGRLTEEAHWNRMLSLGEQQRLGIARAILQAPDYLFLDEATASLDEAGGGRNLPAAGRAAPAHHHRVDRPPLHAVRFPWPRDCAGARWRRSPPAGGRARHCRRMKAAVVQRRFAHEKRAAARREPPPVDRVDVDLFQVGHRRQVELAGDDEGRAAPARAEPTRVDRGDAVREPRVLVAGEGVAVALVQVGIVVAEVEREHALGDADADVPGGVALVGNAVRECRPRRRRRRWCRGTSGRLRRTGTGPSPQASPRSER